MDNKDVELDRLIDEQYADDASDMVSKDGREIALAPRALVEIADSQAARQDCNHPISWGMPAKIAQCSEDKCCPHCGADKESGFDLGLDWGKVFGARCENCSFSF